MGEGALGERDYGDKTTTDIIVMFQVVNPGIGETSKPVVTEFGRGEIGAYFVGIALVITICLNLELDVEVLADLFDYMFGCLERDNHAHDALQMLILIADLHLTAVLLGIRNELVDNSVGFRL